VTSDEGTCPLTQFSISYPTNGTTKSFDIDDDNRCRVFFEKRMGQEVEADTLGE
jgi:small subunit ribosomal protein S6e